ncbi:MAG: protein kinase [Planctomycetes bacterium]|nr:protein kinase [Planctomycetota bacterium]
MKKPPDPESVEPVRGFPREEAPDDPLGARVGEMAVARGLVTREAVEECLAEQRRDVQGRNPHLLLGQILLRRGLITVSQLMEIVKEQQGCRRSAVGPLPEGETDIAIAPKAAPKENRTIGRYRILREIARGGMGVVYEAEDPDLKRRVALKMLRHMDGGTEQDVIRLRREATLAARLSHPGIIDIYEIGTVPREEDESPLHYIAMQFVEGVTFAQAMQRLSVPDRLRILEAVADAVGTAHRQGVVHRDLKPGNILIASDGHPVVTDFGLAREARGRSQHTMSGEILGTPQYMSPEQVNGEVDRVGVRSDVWALGVILYEALTNRAPFQGGSVAEIYVTILGQNPEPPTRMARGVPPELETICLKALEKDPERRYPGAAEFAADLRRFREGRPILARRPTVRYRTAKWLRRHRSLVGALAALVVLVVLTWSGTRLAARESTFRKARAEAESAAKAGDWPRGVVKAEQALEIRWDRDLAGLRDLCRRRIAEADARAAQESRARALEDRLRSAQERIRDVEEAFYAQNIDIRERLNAGEATVKDLESLAADPVHAGSARLWYLLGLASHHVGLWDQAESALSKAKELDPSDEQTLLSFARLCLDRGFQAMVNTPGEDPRAAVDRARQWSTRAIEALTRPGKEWEGAAAVYREIARVTLLLYDDPHGEGGRLLMELHNRGQVRGIEYCCLLMPLFKKASTPGMFNCSLMHRPNFTWGFFFRGRAWEARGDREKAIADFGKAIACNPRFFEAWFHRGIGRYLNNDCDGAISDFEEVIRLKPRLAVAHYYRGRVWHKKKEVDRAFADYQTAFDLGPVVHSFYSARGHAYSDKGDFARAVADFEQALRMAPRDWKHRTEVETALREAKEKLPASK